MSVEHVPQSTMKSDIFVDPLMCIVDKVTFVKEKLQKPFVVHLFVIYS